MSDCSMRNLLQALGLAVLDVLGARVAEAVDASVSKTGGLNVHVGSSPTSGTSSLLRVSCFLIPVPPQPAA